MREEVDEDKDMYNGDEVEDEDVDGYSLSTSGVVSWPVTSGVVG